MLVYGPSPRMRPVRAGPRPTRSHGAMGMGVNLAFLADESNGAYATFRGRKGNQSVGRRALRRYALNAISPKSKAVWGSTTLKISHPDEKRWFSFSLGASSNVNFCMEVKFLSKRFKCLYLAATSPPHLRPNAVGTGSKMQSRGVVERPTGAYWSLLEARHATPRHAAGRQRRCPVRRGAAGRGGAGQGRAWRHNRASSSRCYA